MTVDYGAKADWLGRHILPHEAMLRRWLTSRELQGLEVEDIIQDTYTRILSLDVFDHITSPRTYAFQVASSVMMDYLRRQKVVAFDTVADVDALGGFAEDPSPERVTVARDELRQLAKVLAALPQRVAEVFRLRRIEGLSQRDTAQQLGIAESTVEKHMARGVMLMAEWFGHSGSPPSPPSNRGDQRLNRRHGQGNG